MDGIGNSFSLPFKNPDWLGTFAIMGLISLIPIVGVMNLFGWVLTQLDYYRAGRTDIPPAGFKYIGRGVNIFVVSLVWGLPVALLVLVGLMLFYVGLFTAIASSEASRSGSTASGAAVGAAFSGSFGLLVILIVAAALLGLVMRFFSPAFWIATERRGIGGGLDLRYVWRLATANTGNTLLAALLEYAANLIGSLGVWACYIGYIFTAPYGYLVFAGILRHYEYALEGVE